MGERLGQLSDASTNAPRPAIVVVRPAEIAGGGRYDPWPDDFVDGRMQLYDTGMASMVVMDTDALAALAAVIGRPEQAMLQARADEMRALIEANLWDEDGGIYTNLLANGSFYRRISPTSFYPMIGKGPSHEHVDSMAQHWLMNSTRFCLSPHGDFAGNSDDCKMLMLSRSDAVSL